MENTLFKDLLNSINQAREISKMKGKRRVDPKLKNPFILHEGTVCKCGKGDYPTTQRPKPPKGQSNIKQPITEAEKLGVSEDYLKWLKQLDKKHLNDNIKFTIETKINDSCIQQTVFNNFKEILTKRVVDTEEKSFRNALINLGWTPPKEKP